MISVREIGKSLVLPLSLASSRPTIPSVTLLDLSGNPVPVESLVGHPLLLVSLMATWCRPCLREIPSLVALSRQMGGQLALAGVVEGKANRSILDKITRRYGRKYLLRLDPTMRFASGLHVHALPQSFLIDRQGKIVSRVEGQVDWTNPEVVRYLKSFLEKKAGT
ncbi:MAG: TlpA family protein disulfide reductase [Leptospirillia bacterium]